MPKRVASFGVHLNVVAFGQHSYFQKVVTAARQPLATLCPICPVQKFNPEAQVQKHVN